MNSRVLGLARTAFRRGQAKYVKGMVFHRCLRQTEGFCRSLSSLVVLDHGVLDQATISKQGKNLGKLDSTDLAIHVDSPRKPPKDRNWRRLHIAGDSLTGASIASDLTAKNATDASRVPALIKELERPLGSVCHDGEYDSEVVHKVVENHAKTRWSKEVTRRIRDVAATNEPKRIDRNPSGFEHCVCRRAMAATRQAMRRTVELPAHCRQSRDPRRAAPHVLGSKLPFIQRTAIAMTGFGKDRALYGTGTTSVLQLKPCRLIVRTH